MRDTGKSALTSPVQARKDKQDFVGWKKAHLVEDRRSDSRCKGSADKASSHYAYKAGLRDATARPPSTVYYHLVACKEVKGRDDKTATISYRLSIYRA